MQGDKCSCGSELVAEVDMGRYGFALYHLADETTKFVPMDQALMYWGPGALRKLMYSRLFGHSAYIGVD